MKQKFTLTRDSEKNALSIKEYAEIEKGDFTFICEETHDLGDLVQAMSGGLDRLVASLRRPNMYPRRDFGEKIARAVTAMMSRDIQDATVDVMLDDVDAFDRPDFDIDPDIVFKEGD